MGSHESDDEDARVILDSLRRIVRLLRLSSTAAEQGHGLSGAQLFVLHQLSAGPAASVAELATRTRTDPSSVSVVVRKLVEAGLVARKASAADARRSELRLTTRGTRLLGHAPEPGQARLFAALDALPRTTRAATARGLAALVEHMGAEDEPAPLFFESPRRRSAKKKEAT